MGLDIVAYRGLKLSTDSEDLFEPSAAVLEWTEEHWPGRTCGIKPGSYSFSEKFHFRAGSYSGYNAWRNWLARLAGWKNAENCWLNGSAGGPFRELIDFADNEGVIGALVAAKLAKAFEHWLPKAESTTDAAHNYPHCPSYDLDKYREWMKACQMAADNCAISFH